MTRTQLQRLGWIAAAVALVSILAWQWFGGRAPEPSQPPAHRIEANRAPESTRPAEPTRPREVPRSVEPAKPVDGARAPEGPQSRVPQAPDAKWREGAKRVGPVNLPTEAQETLAAIKAGGPFPHRQDGGVFHNREGLLPGQPRGYYREYTVRTPGSRDRGARRIVTGGDPPTEYYYTADHYRSFHRFEVQP